MLFLLAAEPQFPSGVHSLSFSQPHGTWGVGTALPPEGHVNQAWPIRTPHFLGHGHWQMNGYLGCLLSCSERSMSTSPLPLDVNLGDTDTGSWRACQREESRAGRTRAGGFGWPRPHSLTQLCLPYLTALYESLRPCVSGTRVFFCQIKVRFLTVAAGDSYLLSILSSLCK